MMKNCVDPIVTGLVYWCVAYGLSVTGFHGSWLETPFFGVGDFFVDDLSDNMGSLFAKFTFRLSEAAIATTIVSGSFCSEKCLDHLSPSLGAMATRVTFRSYCVFATMASVAFAIPSYWMWADRGFLRQLKAVDIAGCATLHLVGGVSGLVATLYLGSRSGRFEGGHGSGLMWATAAAVTGKNMESVYSRAILHSPTNALLGECAGADENGHLCRNQVVKCCGGRGWD